MKTESAPRILLVEDDLDEQSLVLNIVREFDSNIILDAAQTGKEAILYLESLDRAELPKLVLLDIDLPLVSGVQVLQRIRQRPETKCVPVTVFTGSSRPADMEACDHLHASYIFKPIVHEDYIATLKAILHYWIRLNRTAYDSAI